MGVIHKRQSRDAPKGSALVQVMIGEDIPCGYTPLDKNEQVNQCINIVAELVSSMTIYLMKNGQYGDERIKNALSYKIDVAPYSMATRKTFIHWLTTQMCKNGNCVVLPKHDSDGNLTDLIPLNNPTFESCTMTDYRIRANGQLFKPDEVLHFQANPSEKYLYIGKGYAPMLKTTIQNMAQANATKKAFLKSKWKPSLIIAANTDAKELKDKELRKKLLESYTETTEAGEPWVIPAGEIHVETIKPLSLNDLAIQDSMKMDILSIASVFGIPGFMVGVGQFNRAEYNNFISTTIMEKAMTIQQELTKKLLYSSDHYFKFSPKSLMQYDLNEMVNYVKEMVGGGMINRNEGRNELNYSPVDDPTMNEFYVLENYIPVAKLGDQKKLKGGESDGKAND